MKNKAKKVKQRVTKVSRRVDIQVIGMVAAYTFLAAMYTSQIYWNYTLEVMMNSEARRVDSLYEAVERKLNPETFYHINSPEDMESELYQEAMETLLDLKQTSGVLYLYTAKLNEDGEFVYVVDGLEEHLDFRFPNDPIEEEIIFKMEIALSNVPAMPTDILHTEWGEIFMAYMPFHSETGEVIGVVGIEFDASDSYQTYVDLKKTTTFMGILLTVSGTLISIYLFRRITNPLYLDKHTKDSFTGMRNRNAYDVDLNNLNAKGNLENIGVIVADINGLKEVNDRLGHSAGDNYIDLVAQAIHQTKPDTMVSYRTGGDEFVIFVQETREEELHKFVQIFTSRVKSQKKYDYMRCSVSCGFTIFSQKDDKMLEDTVKRADELMYQEKRRQKEAQER
ncbi:MAG: GGDEF domain-containing protein [Eubacteriales bacterium]